MSPRTAATRIAFVNNYPMDRCRDWWMDGLIPGHLIWGVQHLVEHGFAVDYVPHETFAALQGRTLGPFGWLDQQLRLMFRRTDIIYSGHFVNVTLLSYLRSRGILRTPLVSTLFMPFPEPTDDRYDLWRRMYLGSDAFVCLSQPLATYLIEEHDVSADRVFVSRWGVDLPFYGTWEGPPSGDPPLFVATGKTDRDYATLVEAASGLPLRVEIYCENADLGVTLPPNVTVHGGRLGAFAVPFDELLAVLRRSQAVLIPTHPVPHMAGQTSLMDALGSGRAVVITRNALLDIDVEHIGAGITVEPHDVAGWRRALETLIADPARTREMGRRARLAAEQHLNLQRFAADLADVFCTVRARLNLTATH